jgi:hypothetical protein
MAVMRKQLNEESRVELKDTSIASNVNNLNHGTGDADNRMKPLNRRSVRTVVWEEAVQLMNGVLPNFM